MKDYSKVKFVKPSDNSIGINGDAFFIKNKVYPFEHYLTDSGYVRDEFESKRYIRLGTGGVYFEKWIPCDENGKEFSND